ncbi:4-hydroxy-tetrahydrodipicolinate synthase [Allofournierella sp.]|uniref:4-hydroxy-tetrahydrodipicolinate synthase n=1 Tax=Allofournierella sp. TaxID=1940256 RepID=UPI003AEFD7FD
MKKVIFTGSGVAIVTPMKPDGQVDFEELGRVIEFQIENGTDSIVICGTTGESATLKDGEHLECIRCAVETTAGRVPVIAGTGSNDTTHAVEMSREAAALGADAVLLVTPYYNKTSQAGLVKHFNTIVDAAGLPAILYNVPSRTGINIQPETALELSKNPLICGIKEASGNISQIAQMAALCGDELPLYSGNDDQVVPLLSLGGKGVISVVANIDPARMHRMCQLWFEGKTAESARLQLESMGLCKAMFCDVNPIPVKAAMNMMGWNAGPCRLPLAPLSQEHEAFVTAQLHSAGLL